MIATCWRRVLAGVSRPASGTNTGELVDFIHTRPTVQARRRFTLVDVCYQGQGGKLDWTETGALSRCALYGTVSAGRRSEGDSEDRQQVVTSARSRLAAPHQALLTSPAL